MRYFKMQLGTNPHVFDVLTIADDGTMTMDCRVCERLVHYDGLTVEHTPYGDRICYGKGSSMPWTDKKDNISARWTEVSCNDATAETEAPTVTEATATTAEPAEQEQPEVCPAVLSQESQKEESPTPSPLAQMQAELEALRRENEELRMKNEEFSQREQIAEKAAQRDAEALQHQREQEQERQRRDQELQALTERELQRQLHRSSSRRISDGQRPDIDRPTDAPAQCATARRKPTGRRWLKPLTLTAASVVACIVIYETGLLIPMGLIGLATSGLVK